MHCLLLGKFLPVPSEIVGDRQFTLAIVHNLVHNLVHNVTLLRSQ
ncbi:hypothetical protein [Spirulina sp. 06S082]|nr:hypothetical protein [Spirulina sp. 06S082]MEA5469026.1 hypothetical protein [Spirulina sp. 06S082]